MNAEEVVGNIKNERIIAIIRGIDDAHIERTIEALLKGGISIMEITMNTPGAIDMIKNMVQRWGSDIMIGAGTVMTPQAAYDAISAGAQFIVCPHTDKRIIDLAKAMGKAVLPGAMTPTEIATAMQSGADLIKLFPAATLGPSYVKQLLGPFNDVPFIAVGGINIDNAYSFIQAGAVGLGIGGELVNRQMIYQDKYDSVTELARTFIESVSI
ncbi:bifunctional 4-hydroxy-2-oxoglutarate aldolase/2-dehydro-3-deoxy-phosphogluconate aldolase [Mahella sp.]|uniref:bifunctional 4-hydroxy-2-oxoglutarate aldolase/2-dehydro-3-deoxy-phosphogluconate aldolase n=1 Tax=Mahella sp. TaxID=2798721 RepID=UPI0025C3FE62|nr:bifunctional 4-hydroxy-2-oxoglutarate aldolase/2-dehydro-3-deoxy-phosphogluconate aldolase [Mahella sp.]MBZ4666336.1 2-dehydro-3-deoxyphosphogluconate aldolase/4-hydroxy-2-oxoglutarate aldolase [Mahella sp.]